MCLWTRKNKKKQTRRRGHVLWLVLDVSSTQTRDRTLSDRALRIENVFCVETENERNVLFCFFAFECAFVVFLPPFRDLVCEGKPGNVTTNHLIFFTEITITVRNYINSKPFQQPLHTSFTRLENTSICLMYSENNTFWRLVSNFFFLIACIIDSLDWSWWLDLNHSNCLKDSKYSLE